MTGTSNPRNDGPDGAECSIRQELEFDIEMCARELALGGMSGEEARAEAERRFGSIDRYVESCRREAPGGFMQRIERIVRVRNAAAAVGVLCVLGLLVGSLVDTTYTLANKVSIGGGRGALWFGTNKVDVPLFMGGAIAELGPLSVHRFEWTPVGSGARPYRAAAFNADFLVIPLWQPLAFAMLVGGLSHGYLRGVRATGLRSCRSCGHSVHDGAALCAECGARIERPASQGMPA
jgi:hypothetical protein